MKEQGRIINHILALEKKHIKKQIDAGMQISHTIELKHFFPFTTSFRPAPNMKQYTRPTNHCKVGTKKTCLNSMKSILLTIKYVNISTIG